MNNWFNKTKIAATVNKIAVPIKAKITATVKTTNSIRNCYRK